MFHQVFHAEGKDLGMKIPFRGLHSFFGLISLRIDFSEKRRVKPRLFLPLGQYAQVPGENEKGR